MVFEISKSELSPSFAILASGILIAGAIVFVNFYSPARVTVPLDSDSANNTLSIRPPLPEEHWRGSAEAQVVLVEFSDFQCPYCSSIHPTLKRIVEESNGKVAWVYRHFPLESIHPQARPAAVASECVAEQLGQNGFWAFADKLFANQGSLSATYYAQVAGELGADPGLFASCVASGKYETAVDNSYNEAVQNGGQGTPFTVVVKGDKQHPLNGALPYEQIQAVISAL